MRAGCINPSMELTGGTALYKYGAITEVTRGIYSKLKTTVFRKLANGEEFRTEEHVILAGVEEGQEVPRGEGPFLLPGDSGSVIFNENLEMVGLAFAGQMQGKFCLFTEVHDLIQDIKDRTGADEVILHGQR
ncbi:hypothetical protein BDV25DRAFT_100288 [Aspergillus avenaceus]|uniref:Peptidase S7 domain-containing protein n=1 Tax=Aspergillus avenaceus TaxID=36643 RepID=A0A5N6TXR8_ASPAV|nr:hypothetical protein BDV25DRAFT_100288 [Aspergillus avenaceus]